jgi:hypothetical protein
MGDALVDASFTTVLANGGTAGVSSNSLYLGVTCLTTTTASSSANCRSQAAAFWMGSVSAWRVDMTSVTGNSCSFAGYCTTALTTQANATLVAKHAGFIFYGDQWYASVADGVTQNSTPVSIVGGLQGIHVLKIDGSVAGHMTFFIDGQQVADLVANIATDIAYAQFWMNNVATGAAKKLIVYSFAYYGN